MNSYPAWLYHREHGAKLVKSEEEFNSLEKGWVDNYGKAGLIAREDFGRVVFDKDPDWKPEAKQAVEAEAPANPADFKEPEIAAAPAAPAKLRKGKK